MLPFILLLIFVAFAVGLAWFLLVHDHGEKEPISTLWLAAGFGLAGGLAAAFLEGVLIAPRSLMVGAPHGTMLVAALVVGVIEETCKFLPLAAFIYKKH